MRAACGEDGASGRAAGLNRLFDESRRALAGELFEGVPSSGPATGRSANTSCRLLIRSASQSVHGETTGASCCYLLIGEPRREIASVIGPSRP
jgi:hypothetical protein